MFWIHGGIFVFGSGSTEFYGPDFLITEDVVVVTINYRLGLLGFLCLEDPTLGVPGNAGLKDVVMALKWVHENIRQFGGDPDNITIFGQSSGAAAVHLLTLSPMGRGLFHKAIGQSGTALSPWASGTRGVKQLASMMKLEGESEETILNHLMMLSGEEILKMQGKFFDVLFSI
jgi:carboxylesterase type B